jgi:hypothetical protein
MMGSRGDALIKRKKRKKEKGETLPLRRINLYPLMMDLPPVPTSTRHCGRLPTARAIIESVRPIIDHMHQCLRALKKLDGSSNGHG